MEKIRSISLVILIAVAVMTSFYLLYTRYKHDSDIRHVPAQEESTVLTGTGADGKTGSEDSEQTSSAEGTDKEATSKAYAFELENIDGKKIKLADYKGKIVVLNFWATWCPYCINEMPDLQSVSDTLKEGKEAVLLTIDAAEDDKTVKDFVKTRELTLPVLLDKKGEVAQNYGIQGFPSTIFINTDGTVYTYIPHATDKETILKTIDEMKGSTK